MLIQRVSPKIHFRLLALGALLFAVPPNRAAPGGVAPPSRAALIAGLKPGASLAAAPAGEPAASPSARGTKEHHFIGPRQLKRHIEVIVRDSRARRGFWGIEVARLSDGKVLYARHPDQLFHPASNLKLFTTAAALEKLPPDFTFRTTVECDAPPDASGRVGDLYLVGRGDPNLSGRVLPYQSKPERREPADAVFQNLADQVAAKGVREITGNLIADDSYFLFEPYAPNWDVDDVAWGYGAPVTALAFNDNALFLRIRPGAEVGELAQVSLEPLDDYYRLKSHVETSGADTTPRLSVERVESQNELDVWGQVPLSQNDNEAGRVAIANPPISIAGVFRRALESRGIQVRGSLEVRHISRFEMAARGGRPGSCAKLPDRVILGEHVSLPVGEDIKVINKVSQNLHAEMLLRTLGRELKNCGSLEAGLEVLQEFATQAGIEPDEIHFADASGLSREDLVTPHAVVKLLEFMSSSPHFRTLVDSLPQAAVDGTLEGRFTHSPAEQRIRAKTGTMKQVNALSGYMDLPSGRRIAFSILGNHHPLESDEGAAIIDRIAVAIFDAFAHKRKL